MFVILDIVLFTLHTFVLCLIDLSVIIRVSSHHQRDPWLMLRYFPNINIPRSTATNPKATSILR